MADPNNPGSIDVRLLGQSELTSLATVVKQMSDSFNVFKQGTEELRLAAEQQMVGHMQQQTNPWASRGSSTAPVASGVPSSGASTVEEREAGPQSGELSEGASSGQETRKMHLDSDAVRQQLAQASPFEPTGRAVDPDEFAVPTGQPQGRRQVDVPGPDASWAQRKAYETGLDAPMALPQYGELTTQNKLFMAAQGMTSLSKVLPGWAAPAAGGLAAAGAGVAVAQQYMPQVHVAATHLLGTPGGAQGMMGINARPGFGVAQYERGGVAETFAGEPDTGTIQNIPGIGWLAEQAGFNARMPALMRAIPRETGIGPLDTVTDALGLGTPAGQAMWDDLGDKLQKRASAVGVTNADAEALEDMLTTAGIPGRGTGTQRSRLYDQGIDFLDRKQGLQELSTETKMELMRPVIHKQGIGEDSMEQFMETMERMPDAARSAQIGVEEFAQQFVQVTEQLEAAGSSAQNARESVMDWSQATGTQAETLGKLMENPYVQGTIAQQSGVLPGIAGVVGQGSRTQMIYDAAKNLRGAYSGIGPKTQQITGPNGEVLGETTISAKAQQDALTAQDLGIPLTQYRRLMREGKQAEMVAPIQSGMRDLDAQMNGMTKRQRARYMTEEGTDDSRFSATEITRYMGENKIGNKTQRGHLRELAEAGDWKKFQKMADNMIDQKTKNDELEDDKGGNTQIGLTDEARKFFKLNNKPPKSERQLEKERDRRRRNKGGIAEMAPSDPDFPAHGHPNARNWGLSGTPGTF